MNPIEYAIARAFAQWTHVDYPTDEAKAKADLEYGNILEACVSRYADVERYRQEGK